MGLGFFWELSMNRLPGFVIVLEVRSGAHIHIVLGLLNSGWLISAPQQLGDLQVGFVGSKILPLLPEGVLRGFDRTNEFEVFLNSPCSSELALELV